MINSCVLNIITRESTIDPAWINLLLTFILIFIAGFQLSHIIKQSQADLLYKVYQDIIKYYEKHKEAMNKIFTSRESINDECFKENDMHILLGYYEAIWNLYYKKKLIDISLAYDLVSYEVITLYEKGVKEIIQKMREEDKDPTYYSGFEKLYSEFKKFDEKVRKELKGN